MRPDRKRQARQRRHQRMRKKVHGTRARPRLSVYRSTRHTYAQVIDDDDGHTLVAAASTEPALAADGTKTDVARAVGSLVAERSLEAGIARVVLDRGGRRYAGRVRALAEAAREAGLEL